MNWGRLRRRPEVSDLTRTHFVKPNWPAVIERSAAAHGEPVEPRGNLVEVEHTSANHHCYGDEIANPRIEYGVAMTDYSG